MSYRYPDRGDEASLTAIAELNDGATWESNESALHAFVRSVLEGRMGRDLRILDLGTARGRLVPEYIGLSSFFAAVDRDRSRIDFRSILGAARFSSKCIDVRVMPEGSLSSVYREPFDFIIVSHVLQHLGRSHSEQLLNDCVGMLARRGLLYIAIPVTDLPDEYFVMISNVDGRLVCHFVSNLEFDLACEDASDGWLPGKVFSHSAIRNLCAAHELRILHMIAYHYQKTFEGDRSRLLHLHDGIPPGVCDVAVLLERSSS